MKKRFLNVHPNVLKLGIVSFLTDVSSEAIFSVFSVFFTVIVGAPASLLGLLEGFSDFSASSLDYLAGWLSDRSGKRKPLVLMGYGFSTLAKTILLFGTSIASLASFRIIERLGKSFRGPPRDAWLGEIAEDSHKGYAFGIHKAMDKGGAILGPLITYFLLRSLGQGLSTFRIIFIMAVVMALVSVIILAFMKDNPGIPHEKENIFKAWGVLSSDFKTYLIPAGIFSLAYFSFGFLLLRAYTLGFAIKDVVLLYALFNVSFVIMSVPFGKLGDLIGRKYIIILGYVTYIVMSLGFIFATTKGGIIILFLLFGAFYSIDEAQSRAFITDIEQERRATAIGVYNFITGLIYLPASALAGFLWIFNPLYAFIFAAVVTFFALCMFVFLKPWRNLHTDKLNGYLAVVLDEESVAILQKTIPPVHKKQFYHHMTIAYMPNNDIYAKYKNLIGTKIRLDVIGACFDDKGQAAIIKTHTSENDIPHITLSCVENTKPVYSNMLLKNKTNYQDIKLTVSGEVKAILY